jgi:FkbM family methyltransferase
VTIVAFDKWEDQEVTGHLLAGEGWEVKHTHHLCSLFSKKGGVGNFLDVGANIGTFSIPMADCLKYLARWQGRSKVISVEGMPRTVDHLVAGITANNMTNLDVYNYAVGGPQDPRHVTMSLNPVNKGGSAVKGNKPFTEMDADQLQDLFHPNQKN